MSTLPRQVAKVTLIAIGCIATVLAIFYSSTVFSTPRPQDVEGETFAPAVTILKPGESADFIPSPIPPMTLPVDVKPVTPGQPALTKSRPSQAEIEKMGQTEIKPLSDDPVNIYVEADNFPLDSRNVALYSDVIATARVVAIHPSAWSTPDGKRPKYLFDEKTAYYIYTRTDVQIESIFSGDVKPGQILTVVKNGGQIGDDSLEVADSYTKFAEGQLLFLYLDPVTVKEIPGNIWRVNEQYNIDPSTNTAKNPFYQKTVEQLVAEIKEAAALKLQLLEQKP